MSGPPDEFWFILALGLALFFAFAGLALMGKMGVAI